MKVTLFIKDIQQKLKKVSFFNKDVRQKYFEICTILGLALTFIFIFFTIPDNYKIKAAIGFGVLLILVYIIIWLLANTKKSAKFKINSTNVNVIVGDIFAQKDLKVIGFNDYMDTIADDKIIAKRTIHGQFLEKHKDNLNEIDTLIRNDTSFNQNIESTNNSRNGGNKTRYKLGSVLQYKSYILTPFAKFDDKNEANLDSIEYVDFWMSFWDNIDSVYAGKTLNIPLLGAGITRFNDKELSKQELLEIMLWTLKISGFTCTYADFNINFIIYSADVADIDFYRIQNNFSK